MKTFRELAEDAASARATRTYHQQTKRTQGAWNPSTDRVPAKYIMRKHRNQLATILRGYRAGHMPLNTKGSASLSSVSMDAAASTALRNHLARERNDYERYEGKGRTNRLAKPKPFPIK